MLFVTLYALGLPLGGLVATYFFENDPEPDTVARHDGKMVIDSHQNPPLWFTLVCAAVWPLLGLVIGIAAVVEASYRHHPDRRYPHGAHDIIANIEVRGSDARAGRE